MFGVFERSRRPSISDAACCRGPAREPFTTFDGHAATDCLPGPMPAFLSIARQLFRAAIERPTVDGEGERVAEGFETTRTITAKVDGQPFTWKERHLRIRSLAWAQRQETSLRERLTRAEAEITALPDRQRGRRSFTHREEIETALAALVGRHGVEGLIQRSVEEHLTERRVRAYGDRPERIETDRSFTVTIRADEVALAQAIRLLGGGAPP